MGCGEISKLGAEGRKCRACYALLDELDEVLRPVEGEDGARAGVGVALVAEVRLDTGGLVGEGQRIGPTLRDPFLGVGVAGGLLGDSGECSADFLRLDDAERLAIDEEDVVGGTAHGLHLADGDATGGGEVNIFHILHSPARGAQLSVDGFTGGGFGCGHVVTANSCVRWGR